MQRRQGCSMHARAARISAVYSLCAPGRPSPYNSLIQPLNAGNDKDGWSEELSFRAPGGRSDFPVRIGVVGDLGALQSSL